MGVLDGMGRQVMDVDLAQGARSRGHVHDDITLVLVKRVGTAGSPRSLTLAFPLACGTMQSGPPSHGEWREMSRGLGGFQMPMPGQGRRVAFVNGSLTCASQSKSGT